MDGCQLKAVLDRDRGVMMSATLEDYSARVRTLELASQSNADRLEAHEDICAERYKNIHETLDTIKKVLLWVGAVVVVGMAGILASQVFG